MSIKLKDRINSYQQATDYKLLNRVPIIISINGRAFSKLTSLLDKPADPKFSECILSTMMKCCTEIEGALFAYQNNDEIMVVVRNDQNTESMPWFENRIQKICSATASIATLHFNNCANAIDLNLMGDPTFTSQAFVVPNITEAINAIVYKQQQNFYTSINNACLYELLNKSYNKDTIKDMLNGLSSDEKIDLLNQECNIDFNNYQSVFKRGSACYKAPKIVDGVMKNKWIINQDLPIFTKDQNFLFNLFKNGTDIYRV